jgi:tetratricopeptide (TPR) repeat protein
MSSLPEGLLERLKNRQAILVAGLGCSSLADFPGWSELGKRLSECISDEADKKAVLALLRCGQLGAAVALCRELVAEDAVAEVLRDASPPTTAVPESLRALARAPWRGIVTTALDNLWPAASADDAELSSRTVLAGKAASLDSGHGRFLVQIFGRFDVASSLCLAARQIAQKIVATGAAEFLQRLHKKWSFVFVGFSPNDPDLALLAGRVLGANATTVEHYFVAPALSVLDEKRVKAEWGLLPVSVEETLEDAIAALTEGCLLASNKPSADEVEAWLERLTRDPLDGEAADMLNHGLAKLRENGEWERLVAALVSRVELEQDPAKQAADLHEAGLVIDKELRTPERAYHVLMTALRLTPKNADLLADTKRMAEAAKQSEEFLRELRDLERESAEADESKPMALGVGRLLAEDPSQRHEAITSFQKVLERDPTNPEAVESLEALYRAAERWDDLRSLYEKTLDRDPANGVLAGKLVELYERLQQASQLIEFLQARLARDPDDDAAYVKLESIYQQGQRWQPLGALYERRLARKEGETDVAVEEKLEALYGKTQQWQPLGALYERQLAHRPDDADILDKVEQLYRRSDEWRLLADLLERRAAKKSPAEARAARLERAALFVDKLKDTDAALATARAFLPDDPAAAEEIYAKCVECDSGNPAAFAALAELARNRGDYLRAAKFYLDAVERTQNPIELGRLFAEAAAVHLDHLSDESKAVELLERALAADPEQLAAAERLATLREKREDWPAAEPLLDLLLRKAIDTPARIALCQRLGRVLRKLGKLDKAAAVLNENKKLDQESPALAREMGDLAFERQAWTDARAEYELALSLLGTNASSAERAALLEKVGDCAVHMGDESTALLSFEEAQALEPDKRSVLEALAGLRSARQEWKEVKSLKWRILPLLPPGEESVKLLEEIGDLQREKLGDWTGAMQTYEEALEAEPNRRGILYKTLDFYTQEKDWPEAVTTLEKLAELESDAQSRAKLNYAIAAIYRDELRNDGKAIELFSKVLDDNPLYPKAFEAIEKLLAEGKQWKELERAYRKQIKRLPQDTPNETKLRLWDALADVALKQHDKESAALTMEVAASLDRDNLARQERLAQMYFALGTSGADKAIAQHQYLLSKQPDRIDSYKALAALYFQSGAHDKMWCVAGAMTCLGKADPPLRALYDNFRPTQLLTATGKFNDDIWRKVLHPSENPYLSALLAVLSPAIARTTAQPHKVIGLARQNRIDLAGGNWSYAAALRYVANTVETPIPDVFIRNDVPGTANPINLKEKNTLTPALVIGIGFDQLSSQSQVVFDLAKRMVMLRPERFPRYSLATPAALEIAIRAGLQLGGAPIGHGGHGDEVDKMAKKLDQRLSAPIKAELKGIAKRYVDACGETVDVAAWIVGSDLTASRAALVLCGDIVAATNVLALEPTGQSLWPVQDRIKDLIAFFVSEDHFLIRAALGMQVTMAPLTTAAESRQQVQAQVKAP